MTSLVWQHLRTGHHASSNSSVWIDFYFHITRRKCGDPDIHSESTPIYLTSKLQVCHYIFFYIYIYSSTQTTYLFILLLAILGNLGSEILGDKFIPTAHVVRHCSQHLYAEFDLEIIIWLDIRIRPAAAYPTWESQIRRGTTALTPRPIRTLLT